MGKTNKAQRTKGNTRPSSSGHSAQLLSLSGKSLNGFIGFDGLEKEKASYVPVTGQQISDSCDSCVDSDFRMVMRKMLKRDSVTRLKAMQEFREFCTEKDIDAVKNVLPFWPRLFNRLALDTDRRIREATHQANGELISKIKRDIAPYLKSIMGVWLLGQCDLYAPAASAAQTTFSTTFPSAKQSDALVHCKNEIFSYFKDNLFEQTAKTLSEPNSTTPEDMENKYTLVISGTLQALKLLLNTVHPSDQSSLQNEFYCVVADKKFWKFAKNKEAQIRGSWYAVVSSICQVMHKVFAEMENKLTSAVLSSLSESDPIVAPSIWEAALSIVVNFENCWEGININKVVLPQLWSLLKEGGKGNAQVLFPCLLPFLSKLPQDIIEQETFLIQFFSSLKESLFLEKVKLSHMECDAILAAFMECLHYMCCVRLDDIEYSSSLLEKVLLNEIIPVMNCSLYTKNAHLSASKLYPLLGSLVQKIEYKCLGKKEVYESFSKVLVSFWENLLPVLSKVFSLPKEKKITSVMYLSYFFNSLLMPSATSIKTEKSKVSFEDEKSESVPCSSKHLTMIATIDPYSVSLSSKKSQSFMYIVKFSELLCEKICETCDLYYLNLLIEVILSASNEELFNELAAVITKTKPSDGLLIQFCKEFIFKWIDQAANDVSKLNSIVELIFILCSNVSDKEALKVLTLFSEIKNTTLMQCLLTKGLEKYNDVPLLQEWFKNPEVFSNIVADIQDIMNKILQNETSELIDFKVHLSILNMCLTAKAIEKPLVDNKRMEAVLLSLKEFTDEVFKLDLENIHFQNSLDFLCSIFMCILNNSKICWNFKATEDLVLQIFHQSITSRCLSKTLSKVWITAIQSYIRVKSEIVHDNSIVLKMAEELHSSILTLATLDKSCHILNHCFDMLSSTQESLILQKSKLQYSALFALYKLMDTILPTDQDWSELKDGFDITTVPLFQKKKLFYPLLVEEKFFTTKNIQKVFLACHVSSKIIINELNRTNSLADEKFFESYITKHFPHVLWIATFFEETSAASALPVELSAIKLSHDCFKMLTYLPNGIKEIVNEIVESSLYYGTYWALPLNFFIECYDQLPTHTIPHMIEKKLAKETLSDNLNKYVLQQIIIPHLSYEKQMFLLEVTLLEILEIHALSNENFAGKLGEISCYLQNSDIVLTEDMQNIIKDTICKVIDYNFNNENLRFAHSLQISAVLSSLVKYGPKILNQKIIYYFVTTLKSFLQKSFSVNLENPTASLELYQVSSIFISLSNLCINRDSTDCITNTILPVFDDSFYKSLVSLYIYVANVFNQIKPLPDICSNILLSVSEAMKLIPFEPLLKTIEESTEVPGIENLTILQSLVSSLTFNVLQIQFTSHSLLLKIMRNLPASLDSSQKSQIEDEKEEEIEKIPACLSPLIKLLAFLTEIVESMLSDIKIGDLSSVLPQTDSYVYTIAYLLSWIEMLEFISSSPSQVRSLYTAHLEETKLLSHLFSNIFRLMPSNPVMCLKKGFNVETPKKEDFKLLFIHPPILNSGCSSSQDIQAIACYVYATVLRKVPASIRTWWNNLDRKSSDIVNKFTTKYISGLLSIEEIQAVHESEKQFENMVVQARPGSREVIATYTIDDCAIELSVQLPINYPLGPISAERRGKIVIGQLEWRHWLMQLTTVLRYQNGSILDGLNIWKRNLDKKFEGVEECMICYYVLHSSTLKLPKLSCRVCKKKFHSACLYKWFDTSYNSTCPLCRNEFFIPMQKM